MLEVDVLLPDVLEESVVGLVVVDEGVGEVARDADAEEHRDLARQPDADVERLRGHRVLSEGRASGVAGVEAAACGVLEAVAADHPLDHKVGGQHAVQPQPRVGGSECANVKLTCSRFEA